MANEQRILSTLSCLPVHHYTTRGRLMPNLCGFRDQVNVGVHPAGGEYVCSPSVECGGVELMYFWTE